MLRVCIVGLGLIGGSLALCLKKNANAMLSGYDVDARSLSLAKRLGIVDETHASLAEAAVTADLILIATPVQQILGVLRELAKLPLKEGCIISDTGSTKGEIVSLAREALAEGVCFVGGHPMAGSHYSGVEAASERLFENAFYVLTPSEGTPPDKFEALKGWLVSTKANFMQMSPEEHDRVVGAISHLPHVVAATLTRQIALYARESPWYEQLAAGGFRDITRIASSNPVMWRDILLQNREVLLCLLNDWEKHFSAWKRALSSSDADSLEGFFREARNFRERIPEKGIGLLPPAYECYVDIPDHPGMIGRVASILGRGEINLTNIRILQNREEVPGVLLLSFRHRSDLEKAMSLLSAEGFKVY